MIPPSFLLLWICYLFKCWIFSVTCIFSNCFHFSDIIFAHCQFITVYKSIGNVLMTICSHTLSHFVVNQLSRQPSKKRTEKGLKGNGEMITFIRLIQQQNEILCLSKLFVKSTWKMFLNQKRYFVELTYWLGK